MDNPKRRRPATPMALLLAASLSASLIAGAPAPVRAAPETKAGPHRPAEYKALEFKLSEAVEGEELGTFTGYANVFGVVDSYNDVVVKGAFKRTLGHWKNKSKPIPLLYGHDPSAIIGWLEEAEEDDHGLKVKARLLLEKDASGAYLVPEAAKVYALIKAKLLDSMSIGFDTIQKETKKGLRYLKEVKLYEVSVVLWPANEESTMTDVKNAPAPGGVKVADFATTLNNAVNRQAVFNLKWKIEDAFSETLWATLRDEDLDVAGKTAAIATNLDQFKAAMLDWTGQFLALEKKDGGAPDELKAFGTYGETLPEAKAGRALSAANVKAIADQAEAAAAVAEQATAVADNLRALLEATQPKDSAAGDSESKGGPGPRAPGSTDSAPLGPSEVETKNRITQSVEMTRIQAEIKALV